MSLLNSSCFICCFVRIIIMVPSYYSIMLFHYYFILLPKKWIRSALLSIWCYITSNSILISVSSFFLSNLPGAQYFESLCRSINKINSIRILKTLDTLFQWGSRGDRFKISYSLSSIYHLFSKIFTTSRLPVCTIFDNLFLLLSLYI